MGAVSGERAWPICRAWAAALLSACAHACATWPPAPSTCSLHARAHQPSLGGEIGNAPKQGMAAPDDDEASLTDEYDGFEAVLAEEYEALVAEAYDGFDESADSN